MTYQATPYEDSESSTTTTTTTTKRTGVTKYVVVCGALLLCVAGFASFSPVKHANHSDNQIVEMAVPVAQTLVSSSFLPATNKLKNRRSKLKMQRAVTPRASDVSPGDERRMQESKKVQHRMDHITSIQELEAALTLAGDNLVMLGIISDEACESYSILKSNACRQISSSMQRIARECEDVTFLEANILNSAETHDLAEALGVREFPTFQYYKHGELLWQHQGYGAGSYEKISEGVLYYGQSGANGLKTEDFVTEVNSAGEFQGFLDACAVPQESTAFVAPVNVECSKQLAILDVTVEKSPSEGSLHIFPAIVSIARNTAGATRWARLTLDRNKESAELAKKLNVEATPTFVFFADGKEVDRYVGSDRMKLINKVLDFQIQNGVKMPAKKIVRRMSNAEARAIAIKQREDAKARGLSQWN